MPENPTSPNNQSEAHTNWCSSCWNGAHDHPCCQNLAIVELSRDEVNMLLSRGASMDVENDDMMDVRFSALRQGFVLFGKRGGYRGELRGKCPEKQSNGLCRLEEDGLPKPNACSVFEAGSRECVKARDRYRIAPPDRIKTPEP